MKMRIEVDVKWINFLKRKKILQVLEADILILSKFGKKNYSDFMFYQFM